MERPQLTDVLTLEYTKKNTSLFVQYTVAQEKYIDYLEEQIEKLKTKELTKQKGK